MRSLSQYELISEKTSVPQKTVRDPRRRTSGFDKLLITAVTGLLIWGGYRCVDDTRRIDRLIYEGCAADISQGYERAKDAIYELFH